MKIKQRIISLLLVVVTIISLLSPFELLVDKAYAEGYGDGSGVGGTLGKGDGKGTFSADRCGVRIYVLSKKGELASNTVDILFTGYTHWGPTTSARHTFIDMFGTRAKDDTVGVLNSGSQYVKTKKDTKAKIPNGSGDRFVVWDRYRDPDSENPVLTKVLEAFESCFPITNPSDGVANGAKLKTVMLGNPSSGIWMPTESSAGSSNDNSDYDHSIDEKEEIETIGDLIQKSKDSLQKSIDSLLQSATHSPEQILAKITSQANQLVEEFEGKESETGEKLYSQDEINDLRSALLGVIDNYKEQSGAFGSKGDTPGDKDITNKDKENDKSPDKGKGKSLLTGISNLFIDTAYAADEAGLEPLYKDGMLLSLMDEADLFALKLDKLGVTSLSKFKGDNGVEKESYCLTIANAGGVIIMENIFWTRLGSKDTHIIYGTPYNWGRYATENNIAERGTKNLGFLTNGSIPKAMFTEKDLELKDGETVTMTIKAGTNVSGQKRIDCSTLASGEYGIGMHYYKFKSPEDQTHTWDKEKFPIDKYIPHPAPDPKEDPPTKDKYPGLDPKTHYRLVKVYEKEIFEENGSKIIQHEETHTRVPTIPRISIEDEKEAGYELIEWKFHKDYYGGPGELENGQDINAEALPITTPWDTTVQCEELSTRIAKVPKEADKSGTEETVVDIDNKENPQEIVTLYVRLRKKIIIPETSTFDEPDHQPSGTPPAVPPHPSQDPLEPKDPNFDPETDHVDEDNPFFHYRVVKVYETILVTDEGEQPPESDGVFVTYKTNPIVQIEDEAQSSDPFDGSWHLKDWCVSDTYSNVPPPDLWKPITDPLPKKQSGTGETKVDLIDKDDREKEVTLYVHFVRKLKEGNPTGAIIIQQSQISKTIHTNDSHIGGYFGNYTFQFYEGAFKKNHTTYFDHCCIGGDHRYHSCRCKGHICAHEMPGSDGDDKLDFAFDLMSSQDELEIKKGIHSDIDPKVYGKGGSAFGALKDGNYLHYPKTLTSLDREDFTFPGDGNDGEGAEYVTILWRGTSKYKDIPTLALYKKKDITEVYGADNYTIPDKILSSVGSTANRKSNKKRASQYWVGDLKFTFGLEGHGDRSDRLGISSCINIGGNQCIDYDPKYVGTYDQFTYDFEAGVAIRFYAGKQIGLQAAPFGSKSTTPILDDQIGKHKERNVIQCKQEIKFYPYIRMTYMLNKLKDAEDEEANTDAAGYVNDVRKDTYVLSEHESSVLPSDAVIVQWEKGRNDENLLLTSQQWSVHQKAVSGSDGWQGKNQVLPGGAIYQLSTPKDDWVTVNLITYQTIVDDKARNEYLTASNTLTGDEYKVKKVAEDHLSFVNDAKEVLDNLKVVQWVNKNVGASTAWTNDFVAKPSNGIVKILDGIEISSIDLSGLRGGSKTHPNDDTKYYMRQQTQLSNYQEVKKLSEWTKTIDDAQGIKEQPFEGDLDVFNVRHKNTVYKLFTDTSGNVYLAKLEKIYSANDTAMDSTETDIQNMVDAMKDLNGDTLSTKTGGATITKLCDKKVAGSAINGILTGDAKEIDDATFFITNFVSALNRNKGTDYTAEWVDGPTEGKWYNDAFDGVYLARQQTTFNVGFAFSASRVSALDPALDPQNKGQSDLYTSAFLSQFCVDSQSDATIAQGKADNYIGTFKDVDITMPDMESMYISKKFYIPNANVQDLN